MHRIHDLIARSPARSASPIEVWSVTQLTPAIKRLVEGEFPPLWVRGEVVDCKAWSSGHWYFTLRDATQPGALLHVAS